MNKSLLSKIYLFLIIFLILSFPQNVLSVSSIQSESISASIGQFYLSLSGYIAPDASVVLISDNVVLRSTVADLNGYFYITGVLINKGFSSFCLDAIDFKRLGESYTCFNISPAETNIIMNDIFLPPTLGLQRSEITIGQDAVVWGYTMPNAEVTIHGSDGKTYKVIADSTGYYQYNFKIYGQGKYELFADALYQNKKSMIPNRKVILNVLSIPESTLKKGKKVASNIWQFLLGSPWGILLILIPLIILIVILMRIIKPEWFTFIDNNISTFFANNHFRQNKLHHAWFVGY